MVEGSRGQPDPGWKLVVEQRQLRDQPLGLLLLGRQRCQTLPDAHQRLDELPLRGQSHGLENRQRDGGPGWRRGGRQRDREGDEDGDGE